MLPTTQRRATFSAVLLAVMLANYGACVAPQPADQPAANSADAASATTTISAEPATLERVGYYRNKLRQCLPGDDLAEDLYYGWMLEPYERATLAIAVKTVAVLEREQQLRREGVSSLSSERIAALYAWLDEAFSANRTPAAPGFLPDRVRADAGESGSDGAAGDSLPSKRAPLLAGPAYFTFADRSTSTSHDRALGDLDLLASAGFRWYAWDAATALTSAGAMRRARAESMGCALLEAPARFRGERAAPAGAADLAPQAVTLADLFAGNIPSEGIAAVIDLPGGEDLVGMLARRQLLRGVTGQDTLAAIGIDAGSGAADSAERVRAAMWLQAVVGQRIGVCEGWRDARDGTVTPYPSRLSEPEYLEAVAHTALDLLRFGDELAACRVEPRIAIALSPDFAAGADPNHWSPACTALLAEVQNAGHPFDLVPRGRADRLGQYALVFELVTTDSIAAGSIEVKAEEGRTVVAMHAAADNHAAARSAGAAIAKLIDPDVAPSGASGSEDGGNALLPVVCRQSMDGRACLLINGAAVRRSGATPAGAAWTDRLTGARVEAGPCELLPWQVRVLVR